MAADPSQNVHEQMLPHVHLINTFRYAMMPRVELPDVTKWLLAAPKIARDTAPFFWTFLDVPADGTIVLTWQPLQRLGVEFASDGYIWSGAENFFHQEVGNGLILEMYLQRAGYRPGEQLASHSRRRFRLTAPKMGGPNTPQVDPSLWVVHYGPTEATERIPVNHIPYDPRINQLMAARQHMQRAGQIVRKEFMLSDRINWPQIPLPREGRGPGQQLYAPQGHMRPVPQQMAYPPHGAASVAPPPKRARHTSGAAAQHQPMMGSMPPLDSAFDDEEDTSRGDLFDHLTPREVSTTRYRQNHEWMEEILSSPYRLGQIVHADLGLGLQGELSSVTKGIFEAQAGNALTNASKKPYIGHLDDGLADEFRRRVEEKMESTNAEIATMKAEHEEMLKKFKSNSLLKQAELDLRHSVSGLDVLRLGARKEDGDENGTGRLNIKPRSVDEVVSGVEKMLGRKAVAVHNVARIQDGGYQEPVPEPPMPEPVPEPAAPELAAQTEPSAAEASASMSRQPSHTGSQNSGMAGDDIDMGGTAAGLLDQMHTGFSSTSTPINNFPTPQPQLSAIPSSVATPAAHASAPSPANHQATIPEDRAAEDVAMEDADATAAPDQGSESGDWVVVPKGGVSPGPSGNPALGMAATATQPATAVEAPSDADAKLAATATSKQGSTAGTPAVADSESLAFDGDHNDFSSLGDLDTAADTLAGYDPPSVDGAAGSLGDGLDLDMEDSAFGDAFHGVDNAEPGSTPADGGAL